MFYDPMIAKLVTWAPTRQEAIDHMREAINAYRIRGVQSNLPFLSALFAHPALHAGDLTTRFIEDHFPDGFNSRVFESDGIEILPLVAATIEQRTRDRNRHAVNAPLVSSSSVMAAVGRSQEELSEHDDEQLVGEYLCVIQEDQTHEVELARVETVKTHWQPGDWLFKGEIDGVAISVGVEKLDNLWRLSQGGSVRDFRVLDPHVAALLHFMPVKESRDLSRLLLSPMPGLLTRILVNEGDTVTAGQDLAIIEAMKMENTLTAAIDGTVAKLVASIGDSLAVDEVILELE